MKKLIFSFIVFSLTARTLSGVYASFTEMVNAQGNLFKSGSFDLQLSDVDSNQDNVADPDLENWSDITSGTWTSPDNWAPGQSFTNTLFIRQAGSMDVESVKWTMSGIARNQMPEMDGVTNLVSAWYDRNGNGQEDANESILAELIALYDDGNGNLTLAEIYDGMNNGVGSFELEAGVNLLPGQTTNSQIGGNAGTGKALSLEWQFDASADVSYQNSLVAVAFDLVGTNLE